MGTGQRPVTQWSATGHSVVSDRSLSGQRPVTQWSATGHSVVSDRSLSGQRPVTQWSATGHSVVSDRSLSGQRPVTQWSATGHSVVTEYLTIYQTPGTCVMVTYTPLHPPQGVNPPPPPHNPPIHSPGQREGSIPVLPFDCMGGEGPVINHGTGRACWLQNGRSGK